jgi:hypothetical protein
MYKPVEPKESKSGMKAFIFVVCIYAIGLTIHNFMGEPAPPISKESECPVEEYSADNRRLLLPGVHFFSKWPFIKTIESGTCAAAVEHRYTYDFHCYNSVHVLEDNVGVVLDRKSDEEPYRIKSGEYYIDLGLYEVLHIPVKQTWIFDQPLKPGIHKLDSGLYK